MFEFTMTKEDVENKLEKAEAKMKKLEVEVTKLFDIRKDRKLTEKESKRLSSIRKEAKDTNLLISVAKEILEEESYDIPESE